ncbi:MAG: formate dehydrogenase subunit alpha [Deltaproteobacteria bacterium]|nr:formate dehydrogenase subunit alpha [Deltaproteobacteria bacterium]
MNTVKLTIDDLEITAREDMTVLEAALENDIYIPHLCYHPDLESVGSCRLCMVEIDEGRVDISCKTQVKEGMQIRTDTPEVNKIRRIAVELLLVNHPADCLLCSGNTDCQLQKIANYIGIDKERLDRMRSEVRELEIDTSNPFFTYDPNKCVLCGICIRTCDDISGVNNLEFAYRGFDQVVSTFGKKPLLESRCVSCGECVVRCPVGALKPKETVIPSREVKTICPYCGVGCGLIIGVRGNRIISTRGDRENSVNWGRLCVKGRYGHEFVNHPDRLKTPLIRRNGELKEASWDEALDLVAKKFLQYKPEEFAAISSAKCTNEDNYVVQKFTRAVMGTNTVDHCARLCHAPSVAGLAQSFGSGAMTNSISEIADARCVFAIGTNTTSAHPVLAYEIKKAVRKGAKLIVANPREIDLCEYADMFLQHYPGTDVALLMGMMRVIVDENLHDLDFIQERSENFEAFKESLKDYPIEFVEKTTGISREKIVEAAVIYAAHKPGMLFYSMGITQHTHGTDNVLATSNIALLTGNVGKPSTGVNPLRGQNNVQGACDVGALPNVYPGYQKVNVPEIKKKFEKAWNATLSETPGLTHTEIFNGVLDGEIKALYNVGENPVLSEANANHVVKAIKQLDFFVVQDIFLTETAKYADVVLPGASFAEKDGTFTNTERRVQRVRKVISPVGQSKPDWRITSEIAQKMGKDGFDFTGPSEIMDEIASLTPSYGGISFKRLENQGLQWPCPDSKHKGTPILHTKFFAIASGKGKFLPLTYKPSAELPDRDYPLLLTTERSIYHFHTATMSRKGGLEKLRDRELVEINPRDAASLGLEDGECVKVISRRGELTAQIKVTDVSPEGVISMTFHFAESPTNVLTNDAIDPVAKIPETKVCAVRLMKMENS